MTRFFKTTLAALLLAGPAQAQPEEPRWIAGLEVVSNYVAAGVSQSGGNPSVRGYAAFRLEGFYGGLSFANVELGKDRTEIDIYAGFAKRFRNRLLLDASYVRYLFDSSGDCCGDLRVKATYPIRDNLAVQAYAAHRPETHAFDRRATAAYAFSRGWGVSATYGRSSTNQNDYWDAGTSFAISKRLSVDLRYYGATSGDEGVVLRLSASTVQTAIARLLLSPFQR